jgi:hypothetical protein
MATKNPRISVMLDPDTFQLYHDFAAAQGRSMSSVIGEMLREVSPPIARTLSLLLAARDAPQQVLNDLAANFEKVEGEVRGMFGDSVSQMDMLLDEIQRRTADTPSCNTGVTTDTPAPKKSN